MNQELLHEYNKFLSHDQKRLKGIEKRITQLAILRLMAFLLILFSVIYLWKNYSLAAYIVAAVSTILFFYWIKLFLKKEKEKILFTNLVDINKKEIRAVEEDYSLFDDGRKFTDPHHPYTFDLDIFGEGSVFQMINRTVTQFGKKKLAHNLAQPETDISLLKKRQEALLELAKYTRWRQFFAAKGQVKEEHDPQLIKQIADHEKLSNRKTVQWLIILLPAISLTCLILLIFSVVPWGVFLLSIFMNSSVLYMNRKTINSFYQVFGKQAKMLESYQQLLLLIEKKEFETPLLQELKQQLQSHEKKASQIIDQLQKTMARFDYRANFAFAIVAELIFVWDLICIYQLDNWNRKYKDRISQWFEIISEFDVLSSLANLNHNHPEWTLPKFEDGEFHFTANNLKHPLIKSSKNIGNDFRMNGTGQIAIITGANMAGKSTFLRAVGVNLVLAMNGCRACASWLGLKPIRLFTNMRTTDNLQKDESYFFAELQRMKAILDETRSGKEVFVLIDEMLKGTNSEDKLSGSVKLIEQFISLQAVGLVATHDLKLTELAKRYPKNIINRCFEIQLNGEDLLFDYKLTDGVTKTMNANFLMKKMGIIS